MVLTPCAGIVKFHEVYLGGEAPGREEDRAAGASGAAVSLEQYMCNARVALGLDSHPSRYTTHAKTLAK